MARKAHHHHEGGMDPHVWLSIPNAEKMVANITAALERKDPAGAAAYRKSAEAYRARLIDLDDRFRAGLSGCRQRLFLHGGHYAFGYLARQYGLTYVSAYAVSPDAEPTSKKMIELIIRCGKFTWIYLLRGAPLAAGGGDHCPGNRRDPPQAPRHP